MEGEPEWREWEALSLLRRVRGVVLKDDGRKKKGPGTFHSPYLVGSDFAGRLWRNDKLKKDWKRATFLQSSEST